MGHSRPLFHLFSVFSNKQILQQINVKKSIQYTVLGFEPTTFGTWVSSRNHYTRAPALFFTSLAENKRQTGGLKNVGNERWSSVAFDKFRFKIWKQFDVQKSFLFLKNRSRWWRDTILRLNPDFFVLKFCKNLKVKLWYQADWLASSAALGTTFIWFTLVWSQRRKKYFYDQKRSNRFLIFFLYSSFWASRY